MPELYWIWDKDSNPTDTKVVIARISADPATEGHIQELYPNGWNFGWQELSFFILKKVKITKAQYDKIINGRKLKVKFKEADGGFISDEEMSKINNNRKMRTKEEFEQNGDYPKIDIIDPVIDLSGDMKAQVVTAPKSWQNDIEIIETDGEPI